MTYSVPQAPGEQVDDTLSAATDRWPMWEVFVRQRRGLAHVHAGSLHAPDGETALQNARDVYARRSEGVSIWVVPSAHISASDPDDAEELFEAADKPYRDATYYEIPDEVGHM
jgi:ring-1,2-phenylacetyl-CoA epoxidase subunit PaaB